MPEILGNFIEVKESKEYLIINFSPNEMPIQQRWRNNGLSADFLSDYWSTFFPDDGKSTERRQAEIKNAIAYIANELLENAMKFSYQPINYDITIGLYLFREELRFYATNSMDPSRIDEFKAFLNEVLSEDPDELYIRQLEKNAAQPEDKPTSRLGFLTMINDYGVSLGWKFQNLQDQGISIVTTMVKMKLI